MRMVALVLVVSLLPGCGTPEEIAEDVLSSEFGADVEIEGDAYTVTDDTGTMRVDRAMPEGMLTPILNGGQIISALERTTERATSRVVEIRYHVDRYNDLVTFYEAHAAASDADVEMYTSGDFLTTTWLHRTTPMLVIEVVLDPDGVSVTIAEGA